MTPSDCVFLMEGLLEAVWLIDAASLRILAANRAAGELMGRAPQDMVGTPVVELAAAPEDAVFWKSVTSGLADGIHSETRMWRADGVAMQVERKVRLVRPDAADPVYVMQLHDLGPQRAMQDELGKRAEELRATLEATADGILVTNLYGVISSCNKHFEQQWEVPPALLSSRNDKAVYAHLARRVVNPVQYAQRLLEIAAEPLLETSDVLVLRSGRVLERVSVPQFNHGSLCGRVYSFRDITQRLEAESRLRLADKVLESSPDAIFITDPQYRILAINPGYERLTGRLQAQMMGTSARDLFYDALDTAFFPRVEQHLAKEGFWEGEAWHRNKGNASCAVHVSWVSLRDDRGVLLHTICFFKDISERLAARKRIEELAYSDVLTGLPNRLLLSQRVEFVLPIAERNGSHFAILILDLDRFKNINDSMGNTFGDRALIEVAERIKGCLRDVDTLCRLGGDEFAILLQKADANGAETAARRVLDALARPFQIDEMSFSIGCSMGVAMYPEDGTSLDELIKHADAAMHRVKENGRGNFRFYRPQMNVDLLSRMKMDHALRQAMEQRTFKLHYQPQISLDSGRVVGAEALIRWFDGELGHVSPAVFIPLAEESGLIVSIGNWVLAEAVRQAAAWQRSEKSLVVSINVSAMQFQQPDFVERIANEIEREGLDPRLLELEMTESILLKDADEALERLHSLAALGVGLSIDDFGTGYSSLAYLKKFPISKLKIDRSFVMGLPDDESDRAIVSATIGMARALKLMVVAEGVETLAQRDYLSTCQCDAFQGFLCSPGLPAVEFDQLLQTWPAYVS